MKPIRRKKESGLANKIIVLVILVAFGGSLFAITQFGSEEDGEAILGEAVLVKGYEFHNGSGVYVTVIERGGDYIEMGSYVNPSELADVLMVGDSESTLENKAKVYITFNPNGLAGNELASTYSLLERSLYIGGSEVVLAYTEDSNPISPLVPLRDCEAVDYETGVIVLELSGETEVISEGGCVYVRGATAEDIELAATKLSLWLVDVKV